MGEYLRLLDEAEKEGADMAVNYLLGNTEHFTGDTDAAVREAAVIYAVDPSSIQATIDELRVWADAVKGIYKD